LFLLPISQ